MLDSGFGLSLALLSTCAAQERRIHSLPSSAGLLEAKEEVLSRLTGSSASLQNNL